MVSIPIKAGMEKKVQEIFQKNDRRKYNAKKIKEVALYPAFRIKRAKYLYENDDKTNKDYFKFILENFEYAIDFESIGVKPFMLTRKSDKNQPYLEIIVDEAERAKFEAAIKSKNGIPFERINIKSIDDIEVIAVHFSDETVNRSIPENPNVDDQLIEKGFDPGVLLENLNKAAERNKAPLSFAVEYNFISKSQAVPRFNNTKAVAYANFPIRLEDQTTYLELSSRKYDKKGNETTNQRKTGQVTIVYTPIDQKEQEKFKDNSYNNYKNSEFAPQEILLSSKELSSVKREKLMSKIVLESAPKSFQLKIIKWKNKSDSARSEKELLEIVTEIRQYIINNNYYGSSNKLNQIIKGANGDVAKIFKALTENMENTVDKESISCQTANSLFQTVLYILDFDAHVSSGFLNADKNESISINEVHYWTEVSIKSEAGRTNFRIVDATPSQRQGQTLGPQNPNLGYEIFTPLIGGIGIGYIVIKRMKKKPDKQKEIKIKKPPSILREHYINNQKNLSPNQTKLTNPIMPKLPKIPFISNIVDRIQNPPSEIEKVSSKIPLDSLILVRKILTTPRYSGIAKFSKAELLSIIEPKIPSENNFSQSGEVSQIEAGVNTILQSSIASEYRDNLSLYESIILENTPKSTHKNVYKLIKVVRKTLDSKN
jgi:hypothetical protein